MPPANTPREAKWVRSGALPDTSSSVPLPCSANWSSLMPRARWQPEHWVANSSAPAAASPLAGMVASSTWPSSQLSNSSCVRAMTRWRM